MYSNSLLLKPGRAIILLGVIGLTRLDPDTCIPKKEKDSKRSNRRCTMASGMPSIHY